VSKLPVIAIVGRPNVGKSTLFNTLTKSRDALVADQPGLTRDRQYGVGKVGPRRYLLVDTGGLDDDNSVMTTLISGQAMRAVEEADSVLLLVDGRAGLSALDQAIAQRLRQTAKSLTLVVNKAEGYEAAIIGAEFQELGITHWCAISSAHGQGISRLMDGVLAPFPEDAEDQAASEAVEDFSRIRVAIIGRPNVGKSTLVNRMLGEERQLTFDGAGTTRDSIAIPFERDGQPYTLIDTAGIRRRARMEEGIEKFSVIKALQAIESTHVVVMLFDAREGMTDQDASLLGLVLDSGRALVLAVNKWDGLDETQREHVRYTLSRKLHFIDFTRPRFISALHGSGVGELFALVKNAWRAATQQISTPRLNEALTRLVESHPPPLVHGRRIKLRYMHQGGQNPPLFVIHGNQTDALPESYKRYLINGLRDYFKIEGTPIRLVLKQGDNPFEGRRNPLTPRQIEKRRRLMRHVKK